MTCLRCAAFPAGSQFCPCGTLNCDQQWPGQVCQAGESCTRHDQTWWRCEPRNNGKGPTPAAAGQLWCAGAAVQLQHPMVVASILACSMQGACGTQIQQQQSDHARAFLLHLFVVCSKTVDTWSACGGGKECPYGSSKCDSPWERTCCKHGDVCVRKDSSWWRCEPADVHYKNNGACTLTLVAATHNAGTDGKAAAASRSRLTLLCFVMS